MSNQLKYGIVGIFVLLAAGLVWLFSGRTVAPNQSKKNVNYTYISSDWSKKYEWDSKDPYGLFLFKKGLEKQLTNKKGIHVISNYEQFETQMDKGQKATYLFIGDEFGLYDEEVDWLLEQIDSIGSDLMVISSRMTDYFIEPYELTFDYSKRAEVHTQYADYPMVYLYQNDTLAHDWVVFKKHNDPDLESKVLTNLSGRPNYIQVKWGKGKVYLNTNPECVMNFQLNRPEVADYGKEFWKYIRKDQPVYLLEFARLKERDPYKPYIAPEEKEGKKDDSYLQLLFNTPALRSALLLTLLGLLLFILFRAKRMRPLIPGIPEKRNMSKIFVQTMAAIYRTKNNPSTVLKLHRRNFYDTVHKHFFIDLSKGAGAPELKSLSEKSAYPIAKLEKLIEQLEAKRNVDDLHLFNCIAQKREFYQLSGIISEKTQLRHDHQKVELFKSIWLIFPLIMIGLMTTFYGLWLLVTANNLGILLMILGAFVCLVCARLLSVPVLRYENDSWEAFPFLGRKLKFESKDIEMAQKTRSGFTIFLKGARKIKLNLQNVDEQKLNVISQYLHKLTNVEH